MKVFELALKGVKALTPKVYDDERGYFFESYNTTANEILGVTFEQDNESLSMKGVFRGLHYQLPPYDQNKLIRCVEGKVIDFVVDIRKDSKTFGQWLSFVLSVGNKHQLFCPVGFAHGFFVLTDTARVLYKVDKPYSIEHERGIHPLDPEIGLEITGDVLLSDKDRVAPYLKDIKDLL